MTFATDEILPPTALAGCAGTDTTESTRVHMGWQLVDVYERIGVDAASSAFKPELAAWVDYARSTVPNIAPTDGDMNVRVNHSDKARVRHRKTLDLTMPGDVVFDAGFGRGYLCALLRHEQRIAAYHGIDIVPAHLDDATSMLGPAVMGDHTVHFSVGDIYELDRSTVESTGATVVVCCEVLEHVPDPEKALKALADALPSGADLVFSVPLYGRLESVWGHLTTFDAARLKAMCASAGLYVHSVEPVANTWTFVVASRRATASDRVRAAAAAAPAAPKSEYTYDFESVGSSQMSSSRWVKRTTCEVSPASGRAVRCEISGENAHVAGSKGQYGGVAFPVNDLVSIRIRVKMPQDNPLERIFVDAYRGSVRTARWRSEEGLLDRGNGARRWAFRIGETSPGFDYHGPKTRMVEADRVEVFVKIASGESTSFTLEAAYVAGGRASSDPPPPDGNVQF